MKSVIIAATLPSNGPRGAMADQQKRRELKIDNLLSGFRSIRRIDSLNEDDIDLRQTMVKPTKDPQEMRMDRVDAKSNPGRRKVSP